MRHRSYSSPYYFPKNERTGVVNNVYHTVHLSYYFHSSYKNIKPRWTIIRTFRLHSLLVSIPDIILFAGCGKILKFALSPQLLEPCIILESKTLKIWFLLHCFCHPTNYQRISCYLIREFCVEVAYVTLRSRRRGSKFRFILPLHDLVNVQGAQKRCPLHLVCTTRAASQSVRDLPFQHAT